MPTLRRLLTASFAAAIVSLPALAHADGVETHDGFYLRLALGGGYLSDSASLKFLGQSNDFTLKGGGVTTELLRRHGIDVTSVEGRRD